MDQWPLSVEKNHILYARIEQLEARIKRIVDAKKKLDQLWAVHHQSLNHPAELELWREQAAELDEAIREAGEHVVR